MTLFSFEKKGVSNITVPSKVSETVEFTFFSEPIKERFTFAQLTQLQD